MATNLRLSPVQALALKSRAQAEGRSQQAVIRDSLDAYLGLEQSKISPTSGDLKLAEYRARGWVQPATAVGTGKPIPLIDLPADLTSSQLIDEQREDRI